MAGRHNRDHSKEQFWRRTFRHWQRSGLSVRAFCTQHGISEPSFYAWRRIISQRDQESARARTEPRQASAPANDDAPVFVPLRVIDAPSQTAIEVVLERGQVVRIVRGFDAATLRQLLAVLEEPSC
jgi:hypothetical protein